MWLFIIEGVGVVGGVGRVVAGYGSRSSDDGRVLQPPSERP